jgi:hypothetical protein
MIIIIIIIISICGNIVNCRAVGNIFCDDLCGEPLLNGECPIGIYKKFNY